MGHEVLGIDARQHEVSQVMVRDDEHDPCQPCCHDSHEHPLHHKACIATVRKVMAVVVMRAVLTAVAVLWAVVFVLVPADLMHGMFALHHNFVASLKGLFAVVARLTD